MDAANFVPKRTTYGDYRWTSVGTSSYALVGEGTTSRRLVDSYDFLRVEKVAGGWNLIIDGEVFDTYRTRSDAKFDGLEYWGYEL